MIALSCMSLHCTICLLWFVYRLNTFRLSAIMSSSICIVAEAMDAYRSFVQWMNDRQVIPHRMEGFPTKPYVDVWTAVSDADMWAQDYLAAHPVAWWNVRESKIVTLLSGLPLSHETKLKIMILVRSLVIMRPETRDLETNLDSLSEASCKPTCSFPGGILKFAIDGMDQAKFRAPRNISNASSMNNLW